MATLIKKITNSTVYLNLNNFQLHVIQNLLSLIGNMIIIPLSFFLGYTIYNYNIENENLEHILFILVVGLVYVFYMFLINGFIWKILTNKND